MDRETWKFANSFAPWLSALGTFSAVTTSLWLATRDRRVSLKVVAGLREIVQLGDSLTNQPAFIAITITNVGRREARVTGIYWRHLFRRRFMVQIPFPHPQSAKLPVSLKDGEQADFLFPIADFQKTNVDYFREFSSRLLPTWSSLTLRVGARTSTGTRHEAKVERALRRWFALQAKEPPPKPPSDSAPERFPDL